MGYKTIKKTNSERIRSFKYLILTFSFLFLFFACDGPQTGNESKLTINPGVINFPVVFVNSTNTQNVDLINAGTVDIKVTSMSIKYKLKSGEVEPESSEFVLVNTDTIPFTVGKGKTVSLGVKFSPLRAVKYDKIYLITESNAKTGNHIVTEIKFSDLTPEIRVSPSSIRFSGINPNSIGEKNIIIENVGSADLIIDAGKIYMDSRSEPTITLEDEAFEDNKNKEQIIICPMESEEDCLKRFEFKVKFAPTGPSTRSGKVLIESNDLTSTAVIDAVEVKGMTAINISTNAIECVLDIYPPENETVIDMGARKTNREYIKDLMLKNNGTNICYIKGIEVIEDDNSVFSLTDLPTFTHELNPGERLIFKANFTPTEVASYSAKLRLESNDSTWTDGVKEIPISGEGRILTGPQAICNPSFVEVEPAIDNPRITNNSIVRLDGSQSTGSELRFSWRKVSGPQGSTTTPQTPTQAATDYFVDLSGEHIVELKVTDAEGESDTCRVELYGLTGNSLHVELFWDNPSDVDLHLRKPNGDNSDWFTGDDCYFGNCTTGSSGAGMPCQDQTTCTLMGAGNCVNGACEGGEPHVDGLEWGQAGRDDNPRLDRDDMSGRGPENINIAAPFDSAGDYYTVGVDYYKAEGNGTTATVRVYCNGDMQYNGDAELEDTKWWWYVVNISWVGDGEDGTCDVIPINRVQSSNP